MYLTYWQYQEMGGNAENALFDRLLARAEAHVNTVTHGRAALLDPVPDTLRLVVFELVETLHSHEGENAVQSFTNDGMSVTYARRTQQELDAAILGILLNGLSGLKAADGKTPLLYAGL